VVNNGIKQENLIIQGRSFLPPQSIPKNDQVLTSLLVQRAPQRKTKDHTIIDMDFMDEETDEQKQSLSCVGSLLTKIQPALKGTAAEQFGLKYYWENLHLSPETAKKIMIFGLFGIFISIVIYLGT